MRRWLTVLLGALVAASAVVIVVGAAKLGGPPVPHAGQMIGYTPPKPTPRPPTVLWVGDSYAAGAGAESSQQSEAYLTAADLGWYIYVDAEGGTGYVNDGHANDPSFRPLIDRLSTDVKQEPHPDLIVVDAGRNDAPLTATVKTAVRTYDAQLAQDYPNVPVVVIEPYFMDPARNAPLTSLRAYLGQQATVRGWQAIDPIGEGWINSTSAKLVASDGVHPNQEGHSYIADHLAPDVRAATSRSRR